MASCPVGQDLVLSRRLVAGRGTRQAQTETAPLRAVRERSTAWRRPRGTRRRSPTPARRRRTVGKASPTTRSTPRRRPLRPSPATQSSRPSAISLIGRSRRSLSRPETILGRTERENSFGIIVAVPRPAKPARQNVRSRRHTGSAAALGWRCPPWPWCGPDLSNLPRRAAGAARRSRFLTTRFSCRPTPNRDEVSGRI